MTEFEYELFTLPKYTVLKYKYWHMKSWNFYLNTKYTKHNITLVYRCIGIGNGGWPSDFLILAFVVFNPGDLYYLGYKKILKK